jgi:hypothetical protein
VADDFDFDFDLSNWRGLANYLTPEQIKLLEAKETELGPVDPLLLSTAYEYHESNLRRQGLPANIQQPYGAEDFGPWHGDGDEGWLREFFGPRKRVGEFVIAVDGTQGSDGSVARNALVEGCNEFMSSGELRELISALQEAADLVEGNRPTREESTGPNEGDR